MRRRDFIGALAAAVVVPALPRGGERMPTGLRNTREAAGPLARGRVLECGVGAGYTMRAILGCSGVARYTGLDIDETLCRRLRKAVPWRDRKRAEIVAADAVAYLHDCDRYDTVVWDIHPMLDAARNEIPGELTVRDDIYRLALSRVAPGGRLLFWAFGDPAPVPGAVTTRLHGLGDDVLTTLYEVRV